MDNLEEVLSSQTMQNEGGTGAGRDVRGEGQEGRPRTSVPF